MKYYPVEVEDGKEFSVKREIESCFSDTVVLVPIESSIVEKSNTMYRVYRKRVQGYIVVANDQLKPKDIKKIRNLEHVIGFIDKPNSDREVETITKEETDNFISASINYKLMLNKTLLIIEGTYSGYMCKVIKVHGDELEISVLIKNTPRVLVPIWFLAEEV